MLAELYLKGSSDPRFLPFGRGGEAADPMLPFGRRIVEHALNGWSQCVGKTFIGTKEEMQIVFQPECAFLSDQANRRIGGKPHGHGGERHANMVGALTHVRLDQGTEQRRGGKRREGT